MDKPFFIMLNWPERDFVVPLEDENKNVAMFETEKEARALAEDHDTCQAFGYEIFKRGMGSTGLSNES